MAAVVVVSSFPSLEIFSRTVATTAPSFLFLDLRLPLIDPAQLNLIEREIARCGRMVPVPICSEIEMGFAGHDDMRAVMHRCYGEPVRRIQARLRRDERPRANARVCGSRLDGGNQSEQK